MPHGSPASSYRLGTVKICGTTSVVDRDLAADASADYFGVLVDVGYSPRSLTLDQAKPLFESPPIPGVVLLFDPSGSRVQAVVEQLDPFAVQLIGRETPESLASLKTVLECQIWKSLHMPARGLGSIDVESMGILAEEYEDSGADVILFSTVDSSSGTTRFGTGLVGDWGLIRGLVDGRTVPTFLGGGLNADNVISALQLVKPNGIEVCSGVESSAGKKDPQKLAKLFEVLAPLRAEKPEHGATPDT